MDFKTEQIVMEEPNEERLIHQNASNQVVEEFTG